MGRVSRLETSENKGFSKSVKSLWTFSEAKNGLKMTFQAISRAENLFPAEGKAWPTFLGIFYLFLAARKAQKR